MAVDIQARVNAGAPLTDSVPAVAGDTIQLRAASYATWSSPVARWELYDFPAGFALPAGWTEDVSAETYYWLGNSEPPTFDADPWGCYFVKVTAADGGVITLGTIQIDVPDVSGLHDKARGEGAYYGGEKKRFVAKDQENLRIMAAVAAGATPGSARANVADANTTLTYAGGRKRTQSITADRTLDIVDAGFSNGDTITFTRLDGTRWLSVVKDPSGVVLHAVGSRATATFERDAGSWKYVSADVPASGSRELVLDRRAGQFDQAVGGAAQAAQAMRDTAAWQELFDAILEDVFDLGGSTRAPLTTYYINKRLRLRGSNGCGAHIMGALGGTQSQRGTTFKFIGWGADDDAVKTEIATSAGAVDYSGGALNGALGAGVFTKADAYGNSVTDERFVTLLAIGDPAAFANGVAATIDGTDENGDALASGIWLWGGAAVNEVNYYPQFPYQPQAFVSTNVNTGTDTITKVAHGYTNGTAVKVFTTTGGLVDVGAVNDSAMPAGLYSYLTYYIVGATADTFQLSLTSGGAAVNITTAGTASSGTVSHYIGRAARIYRTSERFRSVNRVRIPAQLTTGGFWRVGHSEGTVIDMVGAHAMHLEHFDVDCNRLATGIVMRYDHLRSTGDVGSSGNTFSHIGITNYQGPGVAGFSMGEDFDGTGTYQADESTIEHCLAIASTASYQDESGVRFSQHGNCIGFTLIKVNMNSNFFDVNAPLGCNAVRCLANSHSGTRGAWYRRSIGAWHLWSITGEATLVGAYYLLSSGGSSVDAVTFDSSDLRGRAPLGDDVCFWAQCKLHLLHNGLTNNRIADTTWTKILLAGGQAEPTIANASLYSEGNNYFFYPNLGSELIVDTAPNDLVNLYNTYVAHEITMLNDSGGIPGVSILRIPNRFGSGIEIPRNSVAAIYGQQPSQTTLVARGRVITGSFVQKFPYTVLGGQGGTTYILPTYWRLSQGKAITKAWIEVVTGYSGPAIATVTATLGTTADPDRYLLATSIATSSTYVGATADLGVGLSTLVQGCEDLATRNWWTAGVDLELAITCTGAVLGVMSAGMIIVHIDVESRMQTGAF